MIMCRPVHPDQRFPVVVWACCDTWRSRRTPARNAWPHFGLSGSNRSIRRGDLEVRATAGADHGPAGHVPCLQRGLDLAGGVEFDALNLRLRRALLRGRAATGRLDQLPGIVLVWRTHQGWAEHTAVTIGDGYVISKPSQGWYSPHLVWTVPETIAASRYRGVILHRHGMAG